ncbi:sortase [Bacillus sp. 2205SS5-2]|uniref:sortase n=1 Tax=Bacillus sp. 2205SS5-2 TaxID=3109031 RepID=UPI003007CFDE
MLRWSGLVLCFLGACFFLYALFSILSQHQQTNAALEEAKHSLSKAEFSSKTKQLADEENPIPRYQFTQGAIVGLLKLPVLNKELPIVEGTDEIDLEKGVGHLSSTKLPGQQDNIFLAGHRDTVFKGLGKLSIGDTLLVEMTSGTFEYVIIETFIVKEDDLSVTLPTSPNEMLTLSTCYPFAALSSTKERYIIRAEKKTKARNSPP